MVTPVDSGPQTRAPLTRERVLQGAVDYADANGIDSLSMRKLGQELGVEAMSLYNHVRNKEDLLDGMVDTAIREVPTERVGEGWKAQLRNQMLEARAVMTRHPWAPAIIETRKTMSPPMMRYFDNLGQILLDGGFSVKLLHHGLHVLGSRALGFAQELYDDSTAMEADPQVMAIMMQQMTAEYPAMSRIVEDIRHDEESIIGSGCDDAVEFRFTIDLILDGLEVHLDRETAEHSASDAATTTS